MQLATHTHTHTHILESIDPWFMFLARSSIHKYWKLGLVRLAWEVKYFLFYFLLFLGGTLYQSFLREITLMCWNASFYCLNWSVFVFLTRHRKITHVINHVISSVWRFGVSLSTSIWCHSLAKLKFSWIWFAPSDSQPAGALSEVEDHIYCGCWIVRCWWACLIKVRQVLLHHKLPRLFNIIIVQIILKFCENKNCTAHSNIP